MLRKPEIGSTKVTVLLSGGIDSTALLGFYLRQEFAVRAVFVDLNHPSARHELIAAKAVCEYYGLTLSVCECRSSADLSSGEIIGRNAFLLLAALLEGQAESGIIALGIHDGTPYYDCGEQFVTVLQQLVDGYTSGRVKVAAPFLNWGKRTIWELCKEYDVPVHLTYSCESGEHPACGVCPSCRDREVLNAL